MLTKVMLITADFVLLQLISILFEQYILSGGSPFVCLPVCNASVWRWPFEWSNCWCFVSVFLPIQYCLRVPT